MQEHMQQPQRALDGSNRCRSGGGAPPDLLLGITGSRLPAKRPQVAQCQHRQRCCRQRHSQYGVHQIGAASRHCTRGRGGVLRCRLLHPLLLLLQPRWRLLLRWRPLLRARLLLLLLLLLHLPHLWQRRLVQVRSRLPQQRVDSLRHALQPGLQQH